MSKNVVLSGGGTAGHIYPAIALGDVLRDRGWNVYYAGTPNSLESRLVPDAGFPFKAFNATGFDRAKPITLITGVLRIMKSTGEAKKWFREIKPDVVVGFGGYVSIPVSRAAEKLGIPVVVHEQNSVMGMANKYIAKKASDVCLTYAEAAADLPEGAKYKVTGNPVRSEVVRAKREDGRRILGVPEDATLLVVFGGSRGARHINQAISAMKDDLLAVDGLHIVHITGPKELESVQEALALTPEQQERWTVMGYQEDMAHTLAAADAVVSRAGATSLAEIAARNIPAILIPYPFARGGHQMTNAKSYADNGAAQIIDDAEVETDEFREAVLALASNPQLRQEMHDASCAKGAQNAAFALADIVEENVH